MVFLRRNWAVLLALILIPLVVLLAILQLNWIRDMGERERFRLRQGLFVAAGELASAFQRELLLAPWALAPPPFGEVPRGKPSAKPVPPPPLRTEAPKGLFSSSLRGGDWSFFAERLRSWRNYALDPDIIGGIHLIDAREKAGASLASWDGSAFVPEKNGELTLRVLALLGDQGQQGRSQAPRFRPGFIRVDEEEWDLVQIPEEEGLAILLRFDIAVLADRVLPRLAALHLGGMSDYRFRIIDRSTGTLLYRSDPKGGDEGFAQADIRFGLFRQNFGGPDAANRNPSGSTRLGESPVFALRPNRGAEDSRSADSPAQAALDQRQADALWILEAVHRDGPLSKVVRASTIRSATASSGILLLLGVALVVLAFANRRSQALASRQEEFVASVTHELKTPLAVIGSAAENLTDGIVRDQDGLARYGSTIGAETRRLVMMIDKLLLYTSLGAGKIAGKDEVDLASLSREIVAERQQDFAALQFRVELVIPEEPLPVPGDEAALRHAISNLISNVIVHAPEGGYIGVFLKAEERKRGGRRETRALLRVDDRGPGIPRRERKMVFEAFYRGRRAREAQEAGSGIGLNLVRRVVLAHGGEVSLESTEGFGTSVEIALPVRTGVRDHG